MTTPSLETIASPAASLVSADGQTYPLESASITARAEGGIAFSTLAQSYSNPHDQALEVIYTLPLPADGAVLGYTIRMGEKLIRGEVQPREKAEQKYRQALYEGRTAGLLEQTRPDTFQQKLGNVPPHTRVEITIDVLHPLAFLSGSGQVAASWEYRFPTVVGVRYHGAPGRVPDRGELDPNRDNAGGIPTRFGLALEIADSKGASARSTSHSVELNPGEGATRIALRESERLDRDVVVQWDATAQELGFRMLEGRGLTGDDGRYGLVTVVPPVAPAATLRRDLTVLLDASGSMSGEPLELAKRVVGDLLRSLEPGDSFELLAFSNDVRSLTNGIAEVGADKLRAALAVLAKLEAGGGTEMVSAIKEALKSRRAEAQRQVVLVTDGQIGFEAEVVAQVAGSQNVRLHAVGVGSAPNRSLTQQAAAAGRGLELLVGDAASANRAATRLVAGTARPVLTNLRVGGTALTGAQPERLRDVFAGQPLVFSVELSELGGDLTLTGDLAGSNEPWSARNAVPAAGASGGPVRSPLPLGALHGRAAIAELEIQMAGERHGGRAMSDMQIEALGMRHRIASSRTSLVAISEEPSVEPGKPRKVTRLEVEMPFGVSAEAVGLQYTAPHGVWKTQLRDHGGFDLARCEAVQPASVFSRMYNDPPPAWESSDSLISTRSRRLAPDVIELLFEAPYDGFLVPSGELLIEDSDEPITILQCDAGPEPQRAGTPIRLVLKLNPEHLKDGNEKVLLKWPSRDGEPRGRRGYALSRLVGQVAELRSGS